MTSLTTDSIPELPIAEVIVETTPSHGQFNMAMDAALLELGMGRAGSVVRIYEWSEPTITLGYFQAIAETGDSPFPKLPTVRRLTGGGAILHDRESTYSCVIPASHPVRQNASELYLMVHRALIRLLQRCGVSCCLRSEFDAAAARTTQRADIPGVSIRVPEPFLCFLRSNPNDIVHSSGVKIVGSAQRRRRGVTLQHGSILLEASSVTPSLLGIRELSQNFDMARFRLELPAAIADSIASQWSIRSYERQEQELSQRMLEQLTDC